MTLKRILFSILAIVMVATSAQARGHRYYGHHGKRYASIMKREHPVSKFSTFSEHEYPADALYASIWDNEKLNPYKNTLTLPDTFKIVVTGFEAPIESNVTSEYGPRWGRFHAGIDIALKKGDSVRAAFDGQVRIGRKFNKDGYGWYVVIRHENGLETLYGHLSRPLVRDNQIVRAGQAIGLGGSTGRSTGPHLHFETRFLGVPMNPRNIIDFQNNVIFSDTYTIDKRRSFKQYNKFHGIYYGRVRRHHSKKHREMAIAKPVVADSAAMDMDDDDSESTLAENNEQVEENQATEKPAKSAKVKKAMANTKRTIRHTVRPGDNLSAIARKYHTSVSSICKLNHISDREAILSLGKKLIIEAK